MNKLLSATLSLCTLVATMSNSIGCASPNLNNRAVETQTTAQQEPKLTSKLRQALRPLHSDIQRTAFITAVFDGSLTLEQYKAHMKQRYLVHLALEQELMKAREHNEDINRVFTLDQVSTPILSKDLENLMGTLNVDPKEAHRSTRVFITYLESLGKDDRTALLGSLWVLYGGISNGGPIIADHIEKTLSLAPDGVEGTLYYTGPQGFSSFMDRMNTIIDRETQKSIIQAAITTYAHATDMSNSRESMP